MIPEKLQLFDIAWIDGYDKSKGIHIKLKKDGDAQNITYKVYLTPEESCITYQFLDNDDYVKITRKITNVTAEGKGIKIEYEDLDSDPEYKYVSFDIPEPEKWQEGWRLSKQDVLNTWKIIIEQSPETQKVELRL